MSAGSRGVAAMSEMPMSEQMPSDGTRTAVRYIRSFKSRIMSSCYYNNLKHLYARVCEHFMTIHDVLFTSCSCYGGPLETTYIKYFIEWKALGPKSESTHAPRDSTPH